MIMRKNFGAKPLSYPQPVFISPRMEKMELPMR